MIIRNRELHSILHKLWTKAVGKVDYIKEEWIQLEHQILELQKQSEEREEVDSDQRH